MLTDARKGREQRTARCKEGVQQREWISLFKQGITSEQEALSSSNTMQNIINVSRCNACYYPKSTNVLRLSVGKDDFVPNKEKQRRQEC
jgi:hypothetical protein